MRRDAECSSESRKAPLVHLTTNQVPTHAARAAASQLNKVPFQAPPVAARGARDGLWSEQHLWYWARASRAKGSGQSKTRKNVHRLLNRARLFFAKFHGFPFTD